MTKKKIHIPYVLHRKLNKINCKIRGLLPRTGWGRGLMAIE